MKKEAQNTDTIHLVNGVAYIEADLKLAHIRIIMAILKHLQTPIKYKLTRNYKPPIPPQFLPHIADGFQSSIRVISVPVADFNMGLRNGGRLRKYLEELRTTKVIFPDRSEQVGRLTMNDFSGMIYDFSFPEYSQFVDIFLLDGMIRRLLLTEEGYFSYSESSALSLTNKYSVRIYWLICSWQKRGGFIISASGLRKILCAGTGYDRKVNFDNRILRPSRDEFKKRFPIWFEYRYFEKNGKQMIVFKIHLRMTEKERTAAMKTIKDVCFNLLLEMRVSPWIIDDLLLQLEVEDGRPFSEKLQRLRIYLAENKSTIKDVDNYVHTVMRNWLDDWSIRYEEVTDNDLPTQ